MPACQIALTAVLLLSLLHTSSSVASAHHSISGVYAMDKRVHLEGVITAFSYRSPHSFIQLDVVDSATGSSVNWSVEWGSGEGLKRQGIERSNLSAGDRVIILAQPGRDPPENRAHLMGILRPSDGWSWGRPVK